MAINRKQADGHCVMVPAPTGGVTSGDVVRIGSMIGVAAETTVAGDEFTLFLEGVFVLPKTASGEAFAAGDRTYWDETNEIVTSDPDAGFPIGACPKSATAAASVCALAAAPKVRCMSSYVSAW